MAGHQLFLAVRVAHEAAMLLIQKLGVLYEILEIDVAVAVGVDDRNEHGEVRGPAAAAVDGASRRCGKRRQPPKQMWRQPTQQ